MVCAHEPTISILSRVPKLIFAIILLGLIVSSSTISVDASTNNTTRFVGVNFLTLYHLYDTTPDVLQQDFARYKAQGINTIVIVMFWYRLEPVKGAYNQQLIENVIRVANVAYNYEIKVMIDFHTLVGDGGKWSVPDYVGDAMKLSTDNKIAASYVGMVKWAIERLKKVPNIWAYSLLNEPWGGDYNGWTNLIVQLSSTAKKIDKRPVTARFVGPLFERSFGWNSKLLKSLDFISINAYVEKTPTLGYWNSFEEYKAGLTNIAKKAADFGKRVAVTEFGYETPDDTLQGNVYRQYVSTFSSIPNLIGWLSWGWDAGYDPKNPTFKAIGSFSIVNQATGAPRPAFYLLSS